MEKSIFERTLNELQFDNLYDIFESLSLKDKIRFMNTSRKVKEELSRIYGGKERFDAMMEKEKERFMNAVEFINDIMSKKISTVTQQRDAEKIFKAAEFIKIFEIDPNKIRNQKGDTLLIYVTKLLANNRLKKQMIDAVLSTGIDVNLQNNEGETALIRLTYYRNQGLEIKTLLDAGADVNIRDNEGNSALEYGLEEHIGYW